MISIIKSSKSMATENSMHFKVHIHMCIHLAHGIDYDFVLFADHKLYTPQLN